MTRFLHMAFSVDIARWPDSRLAGLMSEVMDDGTERPLAVEEIRAHIADLKARGFEVVPPCDNSDPKTGRCLGHERAS